jgi:hypothetical protein
MIFQDQSGQLWTVDFRLWTIFRNFKFRFSPAGIIAENHKIYFIPTNRKGSIKRFLTRSKLKLTANPKRRKGRRSSQMIGYRIRAATANGQQTIKRKIQSRKVSMVVNFGFF